MIIDNLILKPSNVVDNENTTYSNKSALINLQFILLMLSFSHDKIL